jgi:non-specific serine/threonine protein kinase/serine/threonine-protein kinase
MDAERWERIKAVFQETFEREPAERAAAVDRACGGDATLREAVERLLRAHADAAGFLERLPGLKVAATVASGLDEGGPAPARIGPYRIERELGRGGMGTVYLAERDEPGLHKTVAIKVVRRGMDTEFVLRRFRTERQILAGLDHPGIARLYDGGTTEDGRPYFVMEYVPGETLLGYCDARRLPIAERLRLFQRVCAAVQFAHQRLVVHRDLKPSNILVTREGEPRLLDFGIAKLLTTQGTDEDGEATATFFRIMTPEYASPEQIRGERVTTVSDVYSLGVILYELLSGRRPYRAGGRTPHEIERLLGEYEPERPSVVVGREEAPSSTTGASVTPEAVSRGRDTNPQRLRRQLAGDLDNIVLKALRKEPQRRYESVERLAADIQRHLDGQPVAARQDTISYRAAKFVRRHRRGVAAGLLVVGALIGGTVATLRQTRIAKRERARAERRFNDVRKLANSFMFEVHDAIRDLSGATAARELLVRRALEYLDGLAAEAEGDVALQSELATAYQKVGDVQGNPYGPNLGDVEGALRSYRRAAALREQSLRSHPDDLALRSQLSDSDSSVADLLWAKRDLPGALALYRTALTIRGQIVSARPNDPAARRALAASHYNIGQVASKEGHAAAALEAYRKALDLFAALPPDPSNSGSTAVCHLKIGEALEAAGDGRGALSSQMRALAIVESAGAQRPNDVWFRRMLGMTQLRVAHARRTVGDHSGACDSARKSVRILGALAATDPANLQAALDLADAHRELGLALSGSGDVRGALGAYQESRRLFEDAAARDPTNADWRPGLADLYQSLGDAHAATATGRRRVEGLYTARAWYQRSLGVWLDLRTRGSLAPADAGRIEDASRRVQTCDAALSGPSRRSSAAPGRDSSAGDARP